MTWLWPVEEQQDPLSGKILKDSLSITSQIEQEHRTIKVSPAVDMSCLTRRARRSWVDTRIVLSLGSFLLKSEVRWFKGI